MRKALLYALLIIPAFPENAHAYLNPGTGSFIFQLAIAAFLGGLITLKIYWSKFKGFFKDLFSARRKK